MIRHPQQGFEGHHVQMVLVQGILEAVLAAIDLLGPVLLGRIAEYPALHVLGLNHEYPEAGDEHMVDLGAALGDGQGHIFEQVIFPLVEKEPDADVDKPLPDHALEPGAFDERRDQQQWQQIPELAEQQRNDGGQVHLMPP